MATQTKTHTTKNHEWPRVALATRKNGGRKAPNFFQRSDLIAASHSFSCATYMAYPKKTAKNHETPRSCLATPNIAWASCTSQATYNFWRWRPSWRWFTIFCKWPVVFFEGGVRNHEAHKLVVKDSETTNPSCTWKSIVAKRVEQISLNGKQQKNIIKNRAVKGWSKKKCIAKAKRTTGCGTRKRVRPFLLSSSIL